MIPTYPRVAGRIGSIVDLNMSVLRNGVSESPFALRRVDIYRGSVRPGQLVASIVFPDPGGTYPAPAIENSPGQFRVPFLVPDDFIPGEIYIDVWSFIGNDPGTADLDDETLWMSQSGTFWIFDDVWVSDDELSTKKLAFEPLDKKLRRGEIRTIEVAIHPIPLYDYDFNKMAPIIPQLQPSITIHTSYDELIVLDSPCKIGVRQGSSRNSPFVVQCTVDTRTLVRGTYKYKIKVDIGGNTIISPVFHFTVQ